MYEKCYIGSHKTSFHDSSNDKDLEIKNPNKRLLYLKNITKFKTPNDVERYAFQLTGLNPCSSELINDSSGKWLIKFNCDISMFKFFAWILFFFL